MTSVKDEAAERAATDHMDQARDGDGTAEQPRATMEYLEDLMRDMHCVDRLPCGSLLHVPRLLHAELVRVRHRLMFGHSPAPPPPQGEVVQLQEKLCLQVR